MQTIQLNNIINYDNDDDDNDDNNNQDQPYLLSSVLAPFN